MAPSTRNNATLTRRIAKLRLRMKPLVPLPRGDQPHPAYPRTLLAFHLLTEDELDSMAHFYHQSTPGPWTNHYPANMNWDKEFLAKKEPGKRTAENDDSWLEQIMTTTTVGGQNVNADAVRSYMHLTDQQRVRIKRRKVGKFCGLCGMETPVEEIFGRIQASLDRAVERSREEMKSNEGVTRGHRKTM